MPTILGLNWVEIFHGCVSLLYLETKKEKYPMNPASLYFFALSQEIDRLGEGGRGVPPIHLRANLSRQVVHTVFFYS